MAQEQRLVGLVKGLAQRIIAASDVSMQISTSRLKSRLGMVPSLKQITKNVVDVLNHVAERSGSLKNQVATADYKQYFRASSPRSTSPPNSVSSAAAGLTSALDASVAQALPFVVRTVNAFDRKKGEGLPFDETMREAYLSQYDVVLRASPTDDGHGELMPLNDGAKKTNADEKGPKKRFLTDIMPTTSLIPKKSTPTRVSLSKASVDSRTRALITALRTAKSSYSKQSRTEDLSAHLLHFPDAKIEAVSRGGIAILLNFVLSGEAVLKGQALMALALLGYSFPPAAPGPRILSIDGGGTRGLVALEVLRELENLTGKAPCDLFDYFIGVSTGAVVAAMLASFKLSAQESVEFYKRTCISLFARDTLQGAKRLILSHGWYDTTAWETVLKKNMGEKFLVDLSRDTRGVRLAAVSTRIDEPDCSPFVFRSYGLPCGTVSHYEGSSKFKIWEAMRASTAAPGFFQDFRLDNIIHQDGGILNNNPTAIGIHESRLLWPREKLHTVVSMGTGRFFKKTQEMQNQQVAKTIGLTTSWRSKITSIIASATDTEGIHTTLQDLMPASTYFRVNPILSEDLGMDVSEPKKMDILIKDARNFVKDNPVLMRQIAEKLTTPRSSLRKANDWMILQKDSTEFAVNSK